MAGQVASDADGVLVGKDDHAAQVEQCYLNVAAAVAEAGGTFDNVAKLTVYIAGWSLDKMPMLQGNHPPTLTATNISVSPRRCAGRPGLPIR